MNLCFKNLLSHYVKTSEVFSVYIPKQIHGRFYSDDCTPDSVEMSYNKYDSFQPDSAQHKPPLVIMHGLFGSKTNWQSLSKALNQSIKRTIFAVDARNHGNSPHTDSFNYNLLSNDIKCMVHSLSLDQVCLMGHSMGGRAVMNFSLKYSELVEKLIVVDISPFSSSADMTTMVDYFQIMRSVQIDSSVSTAEGRKRASEQMFKHIKNRLIVDFLLTNLVKTADGTFKWRINLDSLEHNFKSGVLHFPQTDLKFEKPTLFIAGTKSDYLTRDHESRIINMFPLSKFVYLNTGHWVHAEDPASIISNVTDFLK